MKTFTGLMILALALTPSLARADEPAAPPLSGRWTLDPDRSEDGRQKLREAGPMRGPGGGAGGGGRGFPGGSGSGGGGARGGGGGPRGGMRGGGGGAGGGFGDALRSLMEAPPGLTITVTAEEITIIEDEGRFRALHPDRKEYKGTSGEKIQTRWEGARLVVETKGEGGPKLVETFEGSAEELVAVATLEGGRGQPVSVRRVYRRLPPA